MKKQIDTGFYSWEPVPLVGKNGKVKRFTRKGAQRIADRWAMNSGIRSAVGVVSDCGEYWRIVIIGQHSNLV